MVDKKYANYTFHTESGSTYSFDNEGRFHGRESLEGLQAERVAGLDYENGKIARTHLYLGHKQGLIDLIAQNGQEPRKGLYLVLALTNEATEKSRKIGFITSKLKEDPIKRE